MKTIDIFGVIGDEWDGLTASAVAKQLDGRTGPLTVRVNSPGGFAYEGIAIYNLLAPHSPRVEVLGLAASAASVVVMSGDEIHMAAGSELMIHDAWGLAIGNAGDMDAYAAHLRKLSGSIADIYAKRTGDRDGAVEAMAAETFYTADEAVSAGLATHSGDVEPQPEPEDAQAVLAAMGCAAPRATKADLDRAARLRLAASRVRAKAEVARLRSRFDTSVPLR